MTKPAHPRPFGAVSFWRLADAYFLYEWDFPRVDTGNFPAEPIARPVMVAEAAREWLVKELSEPHCGDCVKVCCSCVRCRVEEAMEAASSMSIAVVGSRDVAEAKERLAAAYAETQSGESDDWTDAHAPHFAAWVVDELGLED